MKRRRSTIADSDEEEPSQASQGPKKKRSNQRASTQASQRASTQSSQYGDEDFTQASQSTQTGGRLTDQEREALVNSISRYCLFCHGEKKPIRRTDILAVCLDRYRKNRLLPELFTLAQERLKNIMGMELIQLPKTVIDKQGHTKRTNASGVYILKSIFDREDIDQLIGDYHTPTERTERNLLMIVLSIIELNNGSIDQGDLMKKLKKLDLRNCAYTDPENTAEVWWDKVINITFVNQLYLMKTKTKVAGGDPPIVFRIGPRSHVEIGRLKVMEHIAKCFGDDKVDPIKKREIEEQLRQEETGDHDADSGEGDESAPSQSQGAQASQRGGSSQRGRRGRRGA